MRLSPKFRRRFFYSVEDAGARIGWSRSEAYRAVKRGDIPAEKMEGSNVLVVPKKDWDRRVKKLLKSVSA
jgi:hypothetical protein